MPVTKDLIHDFEQFALGRLARGAHVESLDDLVDEYHAATRPAALATADELAVRDSLADLAQGVRGRTTAEFDTDFRARNGLDAR